MQIRLLGSSTLGHKTNGLNHTGLSENNARMIHSLLVFHLFTTSEILLLMFHKIFSVYVYPGYV